MKVNTKNGMKLKKKLKRGEQIEQEDPDCEPPAPKKKKDKVTADHENGFMDEATDMNGNSNMDQAPKKKNKKKSEANVEVCLFYLNC